jgi:heme/copper-type cytochrome/quinol oxidase subunit 3
MAIAWLLVTILLGASFLALEIYEFNLLINEGHSWTASGFLSSYFTLVGTHGAHIATGLIWATLLFIMLAKKGLDSFSLRRITLFSYFWHFLDIVWIFIFTIVYLLGVSK